MKVYRYWSRVEDSARSTANRAYHLVAWGGSNSDQSEANQRASSRLRELVSKVTSGIDLSKEYEYGTGVIREELVETFQDKGGDQIAAITRNRYGALVLNCADLFIGDIDLPEETPSVGGRLRRLFGRKSPPPTQPAELTRLEAFHAAHPQLTLKIYQTKNGYRVIITNKRIAAQSNEALKLLEAMQCDKLYVQLCRRQECFRARLTPKPWRIGLRSPSARFPITDPKKQMRFEKWLAKYELKSTTYAVCKHIKTLGDAPADPDLSTLIALHDRYTLAQGQQELA